MKRKLAIFTLFLIFIGFNTIFADDWGWPTEKDYFSENGNFVAHVTPPKYLKKDKPLLEVFEITDTQRVLLFQCKMGYIRAPLEVYVSDDGRYVVTVNEHGSVGYGDHVIAFYGKKGRIKNYSMEEILHFSKDISRAELHQLIPHSTSSRWWDENSIKFFDTYAGKLYFCVWLHLFDRWAAWNPANGEEVKVDDKMVKWWNNKGWLWSLEELKRKFHSDAPYEFLGNLKNPDDRRFIEALLSDEKFSQTGRHSRTVWPPSAGSPPIYHLVRYYSASAKRTLAEHILANWDGRPTKRRRSSTGHYYYLGKVEGTVKLPKVVKVEQGTLWVYLVPCTVAKDEWHKKPPIHRLTAPFKHFTNFDLKHTQEFPFGIAGVTPGKYWLKAVLDKTKPLSKHPDRICLPQQGDYQSVESLIITVKAGEMLENVTIDCTQKVTGETN